VAAGIELNAVCHLYLPGARFRGKRGHLLTAPKPVAERTPGGVPFIPLGPCGSFSKGDGGRSVYRSSSQMYSNISPLGTKPAAMVSLMTPRELQGAV